MADKERILKSKDGKLVIRVTQDGIQIGNAAKIARKRRLPGLVTFPIFVGALALGGYMDIDNNTRAPSNENSNTAVVEQYRQQVADIAALKDQGQDHRMKSVDLFRSIWVNSQLSEADVKSLTEEFTQKVTPPATLPGGYVLEHPEYLDEVKAQSSSRDLASLDRQTQKMHAENFDDGPWGGIMLGWLAYIIGMSIANKSYNAGANALQRRREKKPHKPSGPYGTH